MSKVIISCAITGSLHVPTMSPFLPITPEQIATEAIAAAAAGAAVIHLHARDPHDGRPTADPAVFMQFLPRIHAQTDAVINISTGGAPGMSLEQRTAAARAVSPELASLNMGSFSIGLFPMASRFSTWRHPWEQPFLAATEDMVFKNTFADMKWIVKQLGDDGTRFECECYDLSHLYNVAHLVDTGFLKTPLFIQSVLGILGGIGATAANVQVMRATADSLFGKDYVWSLFGAGRAQMGTCTLGALMGGMVRVGLEDSIYLAKGHLASSNAEQVAKIRRILQELSMEIATPEEARRMLSLKGKANTLL
jgi:uncharacterized protein (DUF849 family)